MGQGGGFQEPPNRFPEKAITSAASLPTQANSRIVEIEGPVHEDEVVTRIRGLWKLGRAGTRIQDAVAKGIRSLLVTKRCVREDGFLMVPNAQVPVRNREAVTSGTLRKPDMLPPIELRSAILAIIDAGHGAMMQEIAPAVARMLGFRTTGVQLRSVIDAQRSKLIRKGEIEDVNGMLKHTQKKI